MKKEHIVVLLEEMNDKFSIVLEGHAVLKSAIERNRQFIGEVRDELNLKIDAVHDKLDAKIDAVHDKLDAKIDAVHDKLDAKIDEVHDKLDAKIQAVRESLSEEIRQVADNLAAHRADTEMHAGYRVGEK